MAEIIISDDLPTDVASNAMVELWVDGANAQASRVAPCLDSAEPAPTEAQLAEARLVLMGAVIRWSNAGSGALQSKTVGPYGMTVDTRQPGGYKLQPSEITQLQDICKNGSGGRAFSIDTVGSTGYHSPICSIYFGADDCTCGATIAGQSIFETY